MRPRQIRLPLAPVMAAAADRHCGSHRRAAELLGVTDRTIQRWRDGIPIAAAVELADHLGMHPVELWGDDYIALPADPYDVIGWHVRRARIALDTRHAHGARPCPSTPRPTPGCSQNWPA
jgi:hypothetical protein